MKMWVLILLFLSLVVFEGISFAEEAINPPPILGKPINNVTQIPQGPKAPEILVQPIAEKRPLPKGPPPPMAEKNPAITDEDLGINIEKAITTAKVLLKYIEPGKIWLMKGPRGEIEVKGSILYQGVVVGCVDIDPTSGELLPRGYKKIIYNENVDFPTLEREFEKATSQLEIATGVEFREPERSWIVPVIWKGRIVSFIRIYHDGIQIVPDYKTEEEMAIFGK